jgi:hypothetical protein
VRWFLFSVLLFSLFAALPLAAREFFSRPMPPTTRERFR